jgi:hypothetical protein
MSAKFFYEQIYFIDENGECVYIPEEGRSFSQL